MAIKRQLFYSFTVHKNDAMSMEELHHCSEIKKGFPKKFDSYSKHHCLKVVAGNTLLREEKNVNAVDIRNPDARNPIIAEIQTCSPLDFRKF